MNPDKALKWSRSIGSLPSLSELKRQAEADKRVFHQIYLDAKCRDVEFAEIWAQANRLGEHESGYVNNVYIDAHSQLAGVCAQEIKWAVERRVCEALGITTQRALVAFQNNVDNAGRQARELALQADTLYRELAAELRGVDDATDAFEKRYGFMQKLRVERGAQSHNDIEYAEWRANLDYVLAMQRDGRAQTVDDLLIGAGLHDAYRYERDNRQDLHAASNLLKIAALRNGGTFVPKHLLPQFAEQFALAAVEALVDEGVIEPPASEVEGSRVHQAITYAVLQKFTNGDEFYLPEDMEADEDSFYAVVCDVIKAHQDEHIPIFAAQGVCPRAKNMLFGKTPDRLALSRYDMEAVVAFFGEAGPLNRLRRNATFFYTAYLKTYEILSNTCPPQYQAKWSEEDWRRALGEAFSAFGVSIDQEQFDLQLRLQQQYFLTSGAAHGDVISAVSSVGILPDWLFSTAGNVENFNDFSEAWDDDRDAQRLLSEGSLGSHLPRLLWERPELQAATPESLSAPSRYVQQFIVQISGDAKALVASESLYNKHPEISHYIQASNVSPGGRHPLEAVTLPSGPSATKGPVRLTLVGHGVVGPDASYFGGLTLSEIQEGIEAWLDIGVNVDHGLAINLVGCELDKVVQGQAPTFAQALAARLLPTLQARDIAPEKVTIGARSVEFGVFTNGRKTGSEFKTVYTLSDFVASEVKSTPSALSLQARRQEAATRLSQAMVAFNDPGSEVEMGLAAAHRSPQAAALAVIQ